MVRWNKQKIVDAACIPEITVPELAKLLGSSLRLVEKQLSHYRADIEAARKSIQLSDRILYKILDLWGDGLPQADIAAAMNLPADTIRRVILTAEYEEGDERAGAADSLAALYEAHPEMICRDEVRTLTGACRVLPRFLLAADVVLPMSEETARYKVSPAPSKRPITLATSPLSF